MKTISLSKKEINLTEYKKRSALESDFSLLVTESTKIVDENGKIIVLYYKLDDVDTSKMVWAVKNLKYITSTRTGGLKTTSTIFGYSPRVALRKDFCSATAMARTQPKHHSILCTFAEPIARIYEEHIPDVYEKHIDLVNKNIKPEWKIPNTPFTSGIVNKNNPLKYHFDSGNFPDVYSNMVVFKNQSGGGYLSMPEYDVGLECANNSLVMFDGQSILHGVTPIKNKSENSFRYSVVYYALQQMWNCNTIDEELIRIRQVKQQRELKRI
jgi:hypothetical protein